MLDEARELFRQGLLMGMFSDLRRGDMPDFVWSVDAGRKVYEAKPSGPNYHGYLLEEEDNMRGAVFKE